MVLRQPREHVTDSRKIHPGTVDAAGNERRQRISIGRDVSADEELPGIRYDGDTMMKKLMAHQNGELKSPSGGLTSTTRGIQARGKLRYQSRLSTPAKTVGSPAPHWCSRRSLFCDARGKLTRGSSPQA